MPAELDKLFVCIDHELPDHAQLAEITRGVAAQDRDLPGGDELPRVRDAATGLARSATEASQNVVPVAVTAGDKIEGLRQWASGRCLSADRAVVYSRAEAGGGGRVRRMLAE